MFKRYFRRPAQNNAALPISLNLPGAALILLVATGLTCGAGSFCDPALADQQSQQEIDVCSLYQTSTILGDKDVLVTPKAIRVMDRKNGLGLIARAPQWKVYVLNQRSRRICSIDFAKYKGIGKEVSSITGGISLSTLPLKRGAKAAVNGVPAVCCETSKEFGSKQEKERERDFAGPRFAKWGQLFVADQGPLDKCPRQAKIVLCRFYGVPEFSGQGLPLQFKYVDLADQLHTLLLTNGCKTTKMPANTFDPPGDFTEVANISQLDDRPKIKDAGPKPAQVIRKNMPH